MVSKARSSWANVDRTMVDGLLRSRCSWKNTFINSGWKRGFLPGGAKPEDEEVWKDSFWFISMLDVTIRCFELAACRKTRSDRRRIYHVQVYDESMGLRVVYRPRRCRQQEFTDEYCHNVIVGVHDTSPASCAFQPWGLLAFGPCPFLIHWFEICNCRIYVHLFCKNSQKVLHGL